MKANYKDSAESIFGTCLYKLDIIRTKDNPFLNELCDKIQYFLEEEKISIVDNTDLIDFRNTSSNLLILLGLLVSTQKPQSLWLRPLLGEFYSKIGVQQFKRESFIAQSAEKISGETSEGFWVAVDILNKLDLILPDDIIKGKKLDIFVVPSEAQFNLTSLAIFAHETGHVLWEEKYLPIKPLVIKNFKKYIRPEVSSIDIFTAEEEKNRFFSHTQEYFCDEVGRKIFGIVFDLALLKIMCPDCGDSSAESRTHPPMMYRIFKSFKNLEIFLHDAADTDIKDYISGFLKEYEDCLKRDFSYKYQDAVETTVAEILAIDEIQELELFGKGVDIEQIWRKVKQEIDGFRPPVETVNLEDPEIFKPTEILIGMLLYYYNGKYYEKNNEYFTVSNGEYNEKRLKLMDLLKNHLMYAIGLYDFFKKAKSLFKFDKKELESTLWHMRTRELHKRRASLIIVPSIYPKAQYGNNSVDLRLGPYFLIQKPSKYTHISPYPGSAISMESFYEEVYAAPGSEFILHPHQFILATTLEYISLPYDYYALILGRSSWGRLGLNIATATTVQAGYRGCITLELRNLGETPLQLKVGVRIAQLCLIPLPRENPGEGYFALRDNKYIGPIKAEPPKIKKDIDWKLLS